MSTNKIIKEFHVHGFDCVIMEIEWSGHLCGYVRIPEKHILHDLGYDSSKFPSLEVHGGITFTGKLKEREGYYAGFDCAHSGDLLPKNGSTIFHPGDTFKDAEYVTRELHELTDQLSRLKKVEFTDYRIEIGESNG